MNAAIQTTNVAGAGLTNAIPSIAQLPGAEKSAKAEGSPFSDLLTDAIGKVGQLEDQARTAVNGLIAGSGVDVHQAMIASEKASMAFEMALAVRNKAIQSYQSVMSMQF
ncbi:MAG: flagellar hook-basal body complex protein FliE [Terracidiphilus sp.]